MVYSFSRGLENRFFRRLGIVAMVGTLAFLPAFALAKSAGDFVVRMRAIGVIPDEGGAANDGTTVINGDTSLDTDVVPELDFTYFLTDNIAAELILATTIHQASVVGSTLGNVDLGTVRLLPPTLLLQYHFLPKGDISPYVGAGINYTIFYDKSGGAGNSAVTVSSIDYSNGFGYAFQVGVDFKIDDKWHLNADMKKIFLKTDINLNRGAVKVNDADVDPWIIGVGVGYTF